ncbi:MAG: transposase [Candidatus Hadarchaeum sp.]
MDKRLGVEGMGVAGSEAQRSEAKDPAEVRRGRPGRRGVDERTLAVVELLSGKATVDQVAFRFGVHPKTVEKWREVALEGIEQSMRQGCGKSKREKELERKLKMLERAFTDLAIRHELVERALSQRPTRPGKSSR